MGLGALFSCESTELPRLGFVAGQSCCNGCCWFWKIKIKHKSKFYVVFAAKAEAASSKDSSAASTAMVRDTVAAGDPDDIAAVVEDVEEETKRITEQIEVIWFPSHLSVHCWSFLMHVFFSGSDSWINNPWEFFFAKLLHTHTHTHIWRNEEVLKLAQLCNLLGTQAGECKAAGANDDDHEGTNCASKCDSPTRRWSENIWARPTLVELQGSSWIPVNSVLTHQAHALEEKPIPKERQKTIVLRSCEREHMHIHIDASNHPLSYGLADMLSTNQWESTLISLKVGLKHSLEAMRNLDSIAGMTSIHFPKNVQKFFWTLVHSKWYQSHNMSFFQAW